MDSEWDWPPRRPRVERGGREPRAGERTGWASPRARAVVNVYWSVALIVVKVAISIPIALAAWGAVWLIVQILRS